MAVAATVPNQLEMDRYDAVYFDPFDAFLAFVSFGIPVCGESFRVLNHIGSDLAFTAR